MLYRGKAPIVLRGYSRAGLDDARYADLEDALTADRVTVPVAEILSGRAAVARATARTVVPLRPSS